VPQNLYKITHENTGLIHGAKEMIQKLQDKDSDLESKLNNEAQIREKEDKKLEERIGEVC